VVRFGRRASYSALGPSAAEIGREKGRIYFLDRAVDHARDGSGSSGNAGHLHKRAVEVVGAYKVL